MAQVCEAASAWINNPQNLARMDSWAMRIASLFGADWFRLDLFAGDARRGWVVNEVTYPSHVTPPDAVWSQYAFRYATHGSWHSVEAAPIFNRVCSLSGLSATLLRSRSTWKLSQRGEAQP